ncbi:polyprenol reductase-like [Phlebotomus papatasi]|uniref:polyprenol reductase-like n=1 Tax=Phlebotomus papatasi TaxID=29031 RepID=UPI00248393A2|nr:polyprenol reductase-like [Phlebotomus papatasi]
MILSLSYLEIMYLGMFGVITLYGYLIGIVEAKLPASFTQFYSYGKFSLLKGQKRLAAHLEVSKSSFRHFYIFASLWSTVILYIVLRTCVIGKPVLESIIQFLDFFCGKNRSAKNTPLEALLAIICIFAQCFRRFWETHFLQTFSRSSCMHIIHYFISYLHYFGVPLATLNNAQGFVTTTGNTLVSREQFTWRIIIPTAVFAFAWWHQFRSNVILARLRRDSKGNVVTEKHSIPRGGFFEVVSSPHMMFECLIYLSLILMLPGNTLWLLICLWVVSNQCQVAHWTHEWYKENFPEYPKERKAIIPWTF